MVILSRCIIRAYLLGTTAIVICFIMLCVPAFHAYGKKASTDEKQGFRISGEVWFLHKGSIHIELLDKEEFEKDDEKYKPKHKIIINISDADIKKESIIFEFNNVPRGRYLIQSFQDVNGNGEFDMGLLGPNEPWGMYQKERSRFSEPKFEECAFEVNENIKGIILEVK
jgi:uncharacterized protein (DUF2141 family)